MKNNLKTILYASLMIFFVGKLNAWEDHSTLTYIALADMELESKVVEVNSLSDFVKNNEKALIKFFDELEAYCKQNIKGYPELPRELSFSENNAVSPEQRLLMALRVNPDYKIQYYYKSKPGEVDKDRKELPFSELAYALYNYVGAEFYSYIEGESTDALSVLASAADEPDYGLDVGLFENNDSWFGLQYGFGEQSFGDPRLVYGSQAPFHMGFYNEAGIVYAAAPSMKKVYPELRTLQFSRLARFAMEAGDEYWAYRFMGWGLHYLQDQIMPYHASIMPGSSAAYLVWVGLLDMMGIHGPYDKVLKEVSDKHMLLELLQLEIMYDLFRSGDTAQPLFLALKGPDKMLEPYEISYLSKKVGKASKKIGKRTSKVLGKIIKDRTAFESIQSLYEEKDRDIFKIAYAAGTKQYSDFEVLLIELLSNLGLYSRAWLHFCSSPNRVSYATLAYLGT